VKVSAFPETGTIYVALVEHATSAESDELSDGVVVDYDDAGNPIGIEIELDSLPEFRKAREKKN
jgi:uncharacterized protein YuzE